jgi:hypothetical protein
MASNAPATHTKSNIGAMRLIPLMMVLIVFLYPHVLILLQDSDSRAHAFSELVMGQFNLFTTGFSVALL